jgi:predicted 3-demethylubiquinone-9 3-methyltransferase (glyoxalase superfamily)
MSQKITPCLWYASQTEEAMRLYTQAFADSRIELVQYYPEGVTDGPLAGMSGQVLTAIFELAGQRFMALDGGPQFRFTPASSFFVNCEDEAAFDRLWARLIEGGSVLMPAQAYPFSPKFGWLEDRFGLSWQVSVGRRAQKIVPFLLFAGEQYGRAEAAISFYTSLFERSGIEHIQRYSGSDGGEAGTVQHAIFQLHGQDFMATESGDAQHGFTFSPAVSLYVECETQDEIDRLWHALSAVPEAEQCGWLQDRYGVSWQIIPRQLGELMSDSDPVKVQRVTQAMLQMKKIEIAGLERAYAG